MQARAQGLTRNTRKPYPNICREEQPTMEVRRHYCRLAAWHSGPHQSKKYTWEPGAAVAVPI